MMTKRQGILVLDNVASADQVKELKPAASSSWLLVITAEKKLDLDEAYCIEVEPLDVESAQEFLIDCSLRLKLRAREIAKLCRGLPLALEMCGRFLSSKIKMHQKILSACSANTGAILFWKRRMNMKNHCSPRSRRFIIP